MHFSLYLQGAVRRRQAGGVCIHPCNIVQETKLYPSRFVSCKDQKTTLTDLSRKSIYWEAPGNIPDCRIGKLRTRKPGISWDQANRCPDASCWDAAVLVLTRTLMAVIEAPDPWAVPDDSGNLRFWLLLPFPATRMEFARFPHLWITNSCS